MPALSTSIIPTGKKRATGDQVWPTNFLSKVKVMAKAPFIIKIPMVKACRNMSLLTVGDQLQITCN